LLNIEIKKRILTSNGWKELDIKLDVEEKSFIGITGSSGSGKTTLLRIISGLTKPDSGAIIVDGEPWFDSKLKIDLPPQKRKTGFMFQEHALFPNMTVKQNILYALNDINEVDKLLVLMELKSLENIYPEKLSGGQKQRVALARAVIQKPKILLLDEPFSSLDDKMCFILQKEIKKIHQLFGITIFFVSHRFHEILNLASRIITLDEGLIIDHPFSEKDFISKRIVCPNLVLN
jgi:molybdate transport system ATP-binding protein